MTHTFHIFTGRRMLLLWLARWLMMWDIMLGARIGSHIYAHRNLTFSDILDVGVLALAFTAVFAPGGLFGLLFLTEGERFSNRNSRDASEPGVKLRARRCGRLRSLLTAYPRRIAPRCASVGIGMAGLAASVSFIWMGLHDHRLNPLLAGMFLLFVGLLALGKGTIPVENDLLERSDRAVLPQDSRN